MIVLKEVLLDILCYVDFNTLVSLKFASSSFYEVVSTYANELARQDGYRVQFFTGTIYATVQPPDRIRSFAYVPSSLQSLNAACQLLSETIGQHCVIEILFYDDVWLRFPISAILEAAPALKYAPKVSLHSRVPSEDAGPFLQNFACLENFYLRDLDVNFDWRILQMEVMLKLKRLTFCTADGISDSVAQSELLRYSLDFTHLATDAEKLIDFGATVVPNEFALRLVQALHGSDKQVCICIRLFSRVPFVLEGNDFHVVAQDADEAHYQSSDAATEVHVKLQCGVTIIRKATINDSDAR